MNTAFQGIYNEGIKIKHCSAWQCYYCSINYGGKDKFDRHFHNCTGCPGYVYNFNTQSLLTFEENLKYKGDISLVEYINFETTGSTDECLDPENRNMFAVSYVIIFAFHCTFPIEINPTWYDAEKETMPYADFIIFKEHKLLKTSFQMRN